MEAAQFTLQLEIKGGKAMVHATTTSPEYGSKIDLMNIAFGLRDDGSLSADELRNFRELVMEADLPDGGTLMPYIAPCNCGDEDHSAIYLLGKKETAFYSAPGLVARLRRLSDGGYITADEAQILTNTWAHQFPGELHPVERLEASVMELGNHLSIFVGGMSDISDILREVEGDRPKTKDDVKKEGLE